MNVIVDVQGFKTEANKFILKEIAIIYNKQIHVVQIKPPFPFYDLTPSERKQVNWIERNRGIYWREGLVPYSNHKNYINTLLKDRHVFTKGVEKVLWIQDMLNSTMVYNIEDKGCPNLLSLYEKYSSEDDVYQCIYHPNVCALKNVICINKWCKENKVL